jgi:hypothetical protein
MRNLVCLVFALLDLFLDPEDGGSLFVPSKLQYTRTSTRLQGNAFRNVVLLNSVLMLLSKVKSLLVSE